MKKYIGVIGAGSFGTCLSKLISYNTRCLLFTRQEETAETINKEHHFMGYELPKSLEATTDLTRIADECQLIFPVVRSDSFRSMMKTLAPYLKPYHILIHGTKGFDWVGVDIDKGFPKIGRNNIRTMSEVITEESQVIRVGCVSGPNLSKEIMAGLPAASVIASHFDEVIKLGHEALQSPLFKIYRSHDILGAELAGALKNMIAIGAGIIGGLEMGKNIEAMFITRGLREMLLIGMAMGADYKTFFGNAGLGDLIATATSNNSRNYQFGLQLATGKSKSEIEAASEELAEGVRTVKLMFHFASENNLNVPIVEMLYAVIYGGLELRKAINYLLEYPYSVDVDFL